MAQFLEEKGPEKEIRTKKVALVSKKESNCLICHIQVYPRLQSSDKNFLQWGQLEGASSVPCNHLEACDWL